MPCGRFQHAASWNRGWGVLVLFVLGVCVAHGVAVVAPFEFDDLHQIEFNPAFRDIAYLPHFFTDPWVGSSTGHAAFYRPLLFSTFLADGLLGGGQPIAYRVTSLALLIVFAFVVRHYAMLLLAQMASSMPAHTNRRIGTVAGLLVAVHPLFNESILLASSRSSLMMAILGLAALGKLLRSAPARRDRVCATLLTLAALLTKETAVVLAPLAILTSWLCAPGKTARDRLLASWPVVVPVLFYVVFYEAIFQPWAAATAPAPLPASLANKVSPWAYPAQGGLALLGFARLFFYPIGLSLVHEVPVPNGAAMIVGYAVWPTSMVLGIAAVHSKRSVRWLGIAVLWFVVALAPTLTLVRMNAPLAEHRAVLALVMPLIVVAIAIVGIRPERLRETTVIAVAVVLAAASFVQALPWRDAVDLWAHEANAHPRSPRAWGFLADTLFELGHYDAARAAIANALALEPSHPIYLARAAAIELASGNPGLAERYTKRGLAIEQDLPMLHLVEAERLATMGDLADAYVHADRATRLAPTLGAAWTAKGNVLFLLGNLEAAEGAYRRALQIDPADSAATANLRNIEEKKLGSGDGRS
jgi:tetratricopeptide (TPR) repeat protein